LQSHGDVFPMWGDRRNTNKAHLGAEMGALSQKIASESRNSIDLSATCAGPRLGFGSPNGYQISQGEARARRTVDRERRGG
jgi:hypothetical protein